MSDSISPAGVGHGSQRMSEQVGGGAWGDPNGYTQRTDATFKGDAVWVGTSNPDCGLSPVRTNPQQAPMLQDDAFWGLGTLQGHAPPVPGY